MRAPPLPAYATTAAEVFAWQWEHGLQYQYQRHLERVVLRTRLLEAQNHRCCYCGRGVRPNPTNRAQQVDTATIEHVVPRTRGGSDRWENLAIACAPCNSGRGSDWHPAEDIVLGEQPKPEQPSVQAQLSRQEARARTLATRAAKRAARIAAHFDGFLLRPENQP